MTHTQAIETVVAFMRRINTGDLDGAIGMLSPDVTVEEPPTMPYGGTWRGVAEFRDLMGQIGATWKSWRESPNTYLTAGPTGGVVARSCVVTGVLRRTGQVVEMPFIEMFELDAAGRIALMRPYYWDTGLVVEATTERLPAVGEEQ